MAGKKQFDEKENEKMNELKIELIKQNSKKRKVKKEIARILTLQKSKMETEKKK
jgi:ribosomal protein L29